MTVDLLLGKHEEVLADYPEKTFDAIVCDPPYEINLMGQSWDSATGAFKAETWSRLASLCKPGAWVAAFGARRTVHRLTCAIEDAGLHIHNQLLWVYTTGAVTNKHTQFKGSYEPIVLAQVPFKGALKRTVAQYGTGYIDFDAIRIPYASAEDLERTLAKNPGGKGKFTSGVYGTDRPQQLVNPDGRHPADLFLDPEIAVMFGEDQRYFHICPKASARERNAGLDGSGPSGMTKNPHPAVKPMEILRLLSAALCPAGGIILDPYMGSGSGGCAAVLEDCSYVGVEEDPIFFEVAGLRVDYWQRNPERSLRETRFRAPVLPLPDVL